MAVEAVGAAVLQNLINLLIHNSLPFDHVIDQIEVIRIQLREMRGDFSKAEISEDPKAVEWATECLRVLFSACLTKSKRVLRSTGDLPFNKTPFLTEILTHSTSAILQPTTMLHIAAAGLLINFESRVFPARVKSLWKQWQLRVLVVSSLVLQVALILSGKRRKRTNFIWFRFFVWSTYLLADWVATLALGVIANDIQAKPSNDRDQSTNDLMAFWAPFLLIHLGGPDTITAYSMEDNELWQRRTLELVTQAIATVYIFLLAWPGISWLSALTVLVLIVGLIKFGERVVALRSASSEQFRDSLLTLPDPGPNYAKFMEDFTLKKAEGFYVKADVIVEASAPSNASAAAENDDDDEPTLILNAYKFFQMFKRLFVDLILSFQDRDESQSYFSQLGSKKAFHVIEVELGLIYDAFYTKAPVVYSAPGCILRFITIVVTLIVLIFFHFTLKGQHCEKVDLIITYILMGGAIVLEIIALYALMFSDWARYWVIKHYSGGGDFLSGCITNMKPGKRWSHSMAQYSLLQVCLEEDQAQFSMIQKLSAVNKSLEKSMQLTQTSVSTELKNLIFSHCKSMSEKIKDSKGLMYMCRSRGENALTVHGHEELKWSTTEVEFDQSILLWHIATELCYYCDIGDQDPAGESSLSPECKGSKHISDYMLYLLAMCPFMLPVGIGLIRFRDTCAEAKEFFMNKKNQTRSKSKATACKMLLHVNTEVSPSQVKGDRSKSVLFDACRLATSLRDLDRNLEDPTAQRSNKKWEIISKVWVEILGYAAIHCRGAQHAQRLRKGGELLTHVWLLMAHLGITEQLQIAQGHARAKLNVK